MLSHVKINFSSTSEYVTFFIKSKKYTIQKKFVQSGVQEDFECTYTSDTQRL